MGHPLPNSGDSAITPGRGLAIVNRDLNGTFGVYSDIASQGVNTTAHGKKEGQRKVDAVFGIA